MTSSSLPAFGPSCPSGGSWYACSTGANFVGCCSVNPCSSTCAQGNLYPASFLASRYGTFMDASCPSGSNFYTCAATNPPFMGCCKISPCGPNRCPASELTPAFLGTDSLKIEYGAIGSSSSINSSKTSTSSIARASSTLSTSASGTSSVEATATKDSAATMTPKKDGPPVAAIAGGAAGGAFAVALIVGLLIYYFCHAKKSRRGHEETVVRRQSDLPTMANAEIKDKGMHSPDAPPGYVSPNPNDYYGAHAGQYHQQHQTHQHQYTPQPQELPIEPHTPAPFHQKPGLGHQRNMSELSGETTKRSELETPLASPYEQSQFITPSQSPQAQGWQSPPSPQSGSNWVQHQSWQRPGGEQYSHGPSHGLGLNGSSGYGTDTGGNRQDADGRRY